MQDFIPTCRWSSGSAGTPRPSSSIPSFAKSCNQGLQMIGANGQVQHDTCRNRFKENKQHLWFAWFRGIHICLIRGIHIMWTSTRTTCTYKSLLIHIVKSQVHQNHNPSKSEKCRHTTYFLFSGNLVLLVSQKCSRSCRQSFWRTTHHY